MRIARCVDCSKPLFSKTWKEKLKGQVRASLLWASKRRQEMPVGRYIVKQRCATCQAPLRCSECSEAFFGNLSSDEIRIFIKAMVLFAMKGQCVDCSQTFRFVYHELFEDDSCVSASGLELGRQQSVEDGAVRKMKDLSEIQVLDEFPKGKERCQRVDSDVIQWKDGVVLGDWKRELNDVLCNGFHLVLER